MTEPVRKLKPQTKQMRWGINRLMRFPSLFRSGVSVIPSCAVEGQTRHLVVEKAVQTGVDYKHVQEVDRTSFPEEEKWTMLSKHVVQKQADIVVCECDPKTECRDVCLNALTSIECTPNYCPCRNLCRNQKFQKCEYVRVRKVKTNNRGWGLLADQDIKESDFVIEYCGEVMSNKVAKSRLIAYELAGLKETYMMTLSGTEFLDGTRKGNLARFINHSCEPNCRATKWTVLGSCALAFLHSGILGAGKSSLMTTNSNVLGKSTSSASVELLRALVFLVLSLNLLRGSVENVELDIFATSNEGEVSNQDLLIRLRFLAIGTCNVFGPSSQPKLPETSVPDAKRRKMKELRDQIVGSLKNREKADWDALHLEA